MAGYGKHPILDSNSGIRITEKGKSKSKIGKPARNYTGTVVLPHCNGCGVQNFNLCECSMPPHTLESLSKLHSPALDFLNFTIMRQMFEADAYRTMCSTVSESDFNTLPAVPVSMSLRGSTVSKVDKGVQAVLDKSSHKKATWKKVVRLTLDIGCIITIGAICVFLTGFMWYHVKFKDYQFPSWLTDKN